MQELETVPEMRQVFTTQLPHSSLNSWNSWNSKDQDNFKVYENYEIIKKLTNCLRIYRKLQLSRQKLRKIIPCLSKWFNLDFFNFQENPTNNYLFLADEIWVNKKIYVCNESNWGEWCEKEGIFAMFNAH